MSNEAFVYDQSYAAASDLSTKQFYAVKANGTANQVALAGNGEKGIGILQNKAGASGGDGSARVREIGRSQAVVDGNASAISPGDFLGSNGSGKLVKVTADKSFVFARAEEASTADGDQIEVTVFPGYYLSV